MYDGILSFEHGDVRLGNSLVPGILKSLSIAGRVRFDEAKQDTMSGKVKIPHGWEDSDIHIELELVTDDNFFPENSGNKTTKKTTCYDKLSALSAIFRGHDNGGNPKVYDVINAHARARGIDQVVFAGLDSSETDGDDVIVASLNFVEHNPPVQKKEKQIVASDKAKGGNTTPKATTAKPVQNKAIMEDPGPFAAGWKAGKG